MDDCTRYWILANKAIKEGLITKEQALKIARVGTRKAGFWKRHIRDLEKILHDHNE